MGGGHGWVGGWNGVGWVDGVSEGVRTLWPTAPFAPGTPIVWLEPVRLERGCHNICSLPPAIDRQCCCNR